MADTDNKQEPATQADNPLPLMEPVPKNGGPHAHEAPDKAEAEESPAIKAVEHSMLHWTRMVGIFTAVLAVVGAVQAWSFIESERAFVTVGVVGFGPNGFAANKKLGFVLRVENGGRSPAFITAVSGRPYIGNTLPDVPTYIAPNGRNGTGAIAPGGARSVSFSEAGKGAAGALIDDYNFGIINSGAERLYVFGFVQYTDEFSIIRRRMVGYCQVYDPKNSLGLGTFEDCPDAERYIYMR